ncbi:MAG: bifunctional riboflavin kinase/FAD synthetase [Ignavibacteria bacterium]|jgi:riboflavin kinase/FMN adenylyltransferase|nr:bifunctional riboflavin kinase/FAD synthetase [Ignavibacteria bacterium]
MKILRTLDRKYYDRNSVVTVGTFDGVHRGHRIVIDKVQELKKPCGCRSVILTFEPHPQLILRNKHSEIKLLSTEEEKLELFELLGIDVVYVLEFTKEFASTSAEDFLKKYLVDGVGLSHLVLGFDHSFGKNREGNYETLKPLTQVYGFELHKVEEFRGESKINSTAIRRLLADGDVGKAAEILGANYSFRGEVVTGDRRGNTIGFPTANVKIADEHKLIPKNGVYLVEITVEGLKYFGMMNIGFRPTVSEKKEIFIEVNIFGFNSDIYGKKLKVSLIKYIRDERKFASLDELVVQLNSDKQECQKLLSNINL